jgi:hypothetical protein
MISKEEAKNILKESIRSLFLRKQQVTSTDLEAEVINLACLHIIKKRKQKLLSVKDDTEFLNVMLDSMKDSIPISKHFVDSALELYPNNYNSSHAINALQGIQNNITWDGMWDFLRTYFKEKHDYDIDNEVIKNYLFKSTNHSRYENEKLISSGPAEREIKIVFIGDLKIMVSIDPTLSPKTAWFIGDKNSFSHLYKGEDEDYQFILKYNSNDLNSFTLILKSRQLKIVYE